MMARTLSCDFSTNLQLFGPVLVNYIRQYNIDHGVPKAQAYNVTMYIMAGLLVIGFICNLLVKAVHHRFHMAPDHEALRGQIYVTPLIAGELVRAYQGRPGTRGLTARQQEVLRLFAEGRSAKEVAAVLKISPRTSEFHKARIMEAIGVQSTAELIQYAIRTGMISV